MGESKKPTLSREGGSERTNMELLKEESYWKEKVKDKKRKKRKKPRELGTNPRRKGTNPRKKGTNPRIKKAEYEELKRQQNFIQSI